MARRPRRPLVLRRAIQSATTFRDPGAEAVMQSYLRTLAARSPGGRLPPETEAQLRRAVADRVALLATQAPHLPPQALVMRAINSSGRSADAGALLAQARAARPPQPWWKRLYAAALEVCVTASSLGLGAVPRIAAFILLALRRIGRAFRKGSPEPDLAAALPAGQVVGQVTGQVPLQVPVQVPLQVPTAPVPGAEALRLR